MVDVDLGPRIALEAVIEGAGPYATYAPLVTEDYQPGDKVECIAAPAIDLIIATAKVGVVTGVGNS